MNMNKISVIFMGIMEIFLQSAVFLTGTVVVCYEALGFGTADFPICLIIVAAVFFAWFLRRKRISNRMFYICHLLLLILSFVAGRNANEKFLLSVVMLLLIGYSSYTMYRSENGDKERPSYYMLVVMLFAFITGSRQNNEIVVYTSIVAAFTFVIISAVYDNMYHMGLVFRENREMHDFPKQRIIRINGCVMAVTSAVMIIAMFIFWKIGSGDFTFLGDMGIVLGRTIATVLIWLLGLFGRESNGEHLPQPEPEPEDPEEFDDDPLKYPDLGPWQNLLNAVAAVIAIAIIAVVLVMIIKSLNRFMRKQRVKQEGNDTIEFIKDEDKKGFVKAVKVKKGAVPAVLSDNQRLRKSYRQLVRKGMKRNKLKRLPLSMAPSEITFSNITRDEELADAVTQAYETARYSDGSVTKEQMEQLKQLK